MIGTHQRDDDDVTFLPLKSIYRIDADKPSEGLEVFAAAHQPAQVLHLCSIGRDDAHIDALVEQTLFADALEVMLKGFERQCSLLFINTTERIANKLLMHLLSAGVNPLDGNIQIEYSTILHIGSTLHLTIIEIVGREAHDVFVHAVLRLQQTDSRGFCLYQMLHQCAAQTSLESSNALYRGRQLAVVAGKDDSAHTAHGNPTGSFQCLCCFVDKEAAELSAVQQSMAGSYQSAGNHSCIVEEFLVDAYLQFGGTPFQTFHLLVEFLIAALSVSTQITYGFADGP